MNKLFTSLRGSRVLVTGGSGFIGTNLVKALRDLNCEILNLSNEPPKIAIHKFHFVNVDIRNRDLLFEQFRSFQPDYVVHLAARTDLNGISLLDYDANIFGVQNIIDAVSSTSSVRLCIYASTRLVFEIGHTPDHPFDYKPSTLYGESKCHGERLVRAQPLNSTPWIILRPTSVWGEWFSIPYRNFFDAILKRRYFHLGNLKVAKSFGYVGNIVHQILCYMDTLPDDNLRQAFFLSDYAPIDVLNFANLISAKAGLPPVACAPYSVLLAAAKVGDIVQKLGIPDPPLTSFRLANLATNMVYDLTREERFCGPLPFGLDESVQRTLNWLNSVQ
jgi:nucleoside-diphosphate-sugar epimerase